ncbi:MAG: hypothetical protein K2N71_01410, partial [Oscillospiraceae bacterium]|nr:hypothetical protein [Oscillospiraceae bacterium]
MLFGNAVFFPTIAVSAESQTITIMPNETKTITFTGELNEETNENERAWANLGDDKYKVLPVIQAAAAPHLGCSADEVAIEDITVTYDYAFTTEDSDLAAGDAGIGLDFYGTCMNTDYGSVDLSTNSVPHSDALAGTDKTVTFSAMCPAGTNINRIWYFDLEIHGNGKQGESLTLTVKKIEASVRYEKSYNEINISYSELQGKDAIKLTYNAGKASECGHPAEEHGAGFSGTYCPYAGVPVYCVSYDGSHGSDGSDGGENVEYWFCAGEDKPVITAVVLLKEIYSKTGTPKAGETLTFYGGIMGEPVSYELIANYVPDDIVFNTGSVTSGTIQEGSDWDSTTNSAVSNGKPDLNIGEISLCEGSGRKSFDGYKALQIDYTAADTSQLSGISVVLQGWEADGVGWVQPYYAASDSGTIMIDLTPYQSSSYNNIYVHAVAPATAKIGDSFTPGFTVTSAKLITAYDGSFSSTIPEIKPVEEQPSNPSSPSTPSTPSTPPTPSAPSTPSIPSAPSSSSAGSQNISLSTTEKAVEEINKATEGTTVNISLTGSTVADKEIFIAIAGKDIDIKITVSGGVTIEINGKDVENAKNVDLGVKMNSNAIKEERVNEIAKDKDTTQFSLKHNGDFGFKATFNLPVNKKYNGKYANIYWDNKGKLEFIGSSYVQDSRVAYTTNHASDYVMVFDDYAYGEDVSSASGVYESSESDSYEICAAFVLIIGISAVTIKKFIVKSK